MILAAMIRGMTYLFAGMLGLVTVILATFFITEGIIYMASWECALFIEWVLGV